MTFSPSSFVRRTAGFVTTPLAVGYNGLASGYDWFAERRDRFSHKQVKAQRSRSTFATYALVGGFALGLCFLGAGWVGQPLMSAAIRGYMRYGQSGGPATSHTARKRYEKYCRHRGAAPIASFAGCNPLVA